MLYWSYSTYVQKIQTSGMNISRQINFTHFPTPSRFLIVFQKIFLKFQLIFLLILKIFIIFFWGDVSKTNKLVTKRSFLSNSLNTNYLASSNLNENYNLLIFWAKHKNVVDLETEILFIRLVHNYYYSNEILELHYIISNN